MCSSRPAMHGTHALAIQATLRQALSHVIITCHYRIVCKLHWRAGNQSFSRSCHLAWLVLCLFHSSDYTMDRYEPKIYALYHSSFQQVLMLDADNMPLQDPTYLFDAPHMVQHGAMVWLDLWSPQLSSTTCVGHDTVYPLVGLNKQAYWVRSWNTDPCSYCQ